MDGIASVKIEKFFAKYSSKFADKGEILIHGYRGQKSIHYLVLGRVKQYVINSQGDEIVINTFGESDLFPLFWINKINKQKYFFETTLVSEFRSAPFDDFVSFIKKNGEISFELMKLLCLSFDNMQQRMFHAMKDCARNRTIFELLMECKRFGKKLKNGSWSVSLHEDELARQVGLSRETINREIAKLKNLNLVSITCKGLIINDIEKLQSVFDDSV